MASLYNKNGIYYFSIYFQGKRITRSLKTSDIRIAKKLARELEPEFLSNLIIPSRQKSNHNYSEMELANLFLNANHGWTDKTLEINRNCLNHYFKYGFPKTKYRAMVVRSLNHMYNWALKNNIITENGFKHFDGGNKWGHRTRVLNKIELNTLFDGIADSSFNRFVRFAYYTGARSGEIRCIQPENIKDGYLIVCGKTGRRLIKINTQAQDILSQCENQWDYSSDFVSHKFKKEARRLGIPDIRFHDLRRTFGYNLIKQGRPIYEVSKLLGHSSVTTTEKHYAPLIATDVDDFIL